MLLFFWLADKYPIMNDLVVIWYKSLSFFYHSTERDHPKYVTLDSKATKKKCSQDKNSCQKLHYLCSDSRTIYPPETYELAKANCAKDGLLAF